MRILLTTLFVFLGLAVTLAASRSRAACVER